MLKLVSTAQMREIDRRSIEDFGVPETILMENAGLQTLHYLEECLDGLSGRRIGIFCGKGNNGGDGFVLARHLHLKGVDTAVYLLAEKKSLKGDAKLNMEAFANMGGKIKEFLSESDVRKHKIAIRHADALVDAILGTGIKSELAGIYKTAVEKINDWGRYVLAVDIPSGLCSDRGDVYGLHVRADATITFGYPMTGMAFYPAAKSVGRLKSVNISFPQQVLDESDCEAYLPDNDWARETLPERPQDAHKGRFGHAVVSGGSTGMGGALGLASYAALKVGAGLVTAAASHQLCREFELGIKDVMSYHLGDDLAKPENAEALVEFCKDKSVLLIGPGMGRGAGLTELVSGVVENSRVPLVIDADGLNNLAPNKDILKKVKQPVVITPHPGEMSRLNEMGTDEINKNRLEVAKSFSSRYNCVTVLKGARTVVADPDGTAYVNMTGNVNLATGGTGDVLSGMIAGFMAQNVEPVKAAALAVYIHGLAADIYTHEENPYSLSASDLLDYIPIAITELLNKE